jgi:antitoxin YefM
MSTIPLSEAKARLSEIADEVGRTHERVHITRNGREYVVLLAAEDLESIEATLELLADTRAQERIAAAEADFAAGEVLDEQQVRALMDTRARPQTE